MSLRTRLRRATARILVGAEMDGRDLLRRHVTLLLLLVLPLVFYFSARANGLKAVPLENGTVGMAFATSGIAYFSTAGSRDVDIRLVLCGFPPGLLVAGRLLLLNGIAAAIAGIFSVIMILGSHPANSSPELLLAVMLTAAVAIALGLTVGTTIPNEMEGILTIIAVVGVQLSLSRTSALGMLLPFWGPRQLADHAETGGTVLWPVVHCVLYGAALLTGALLTWRLRMRPRHYPPPGEVAHPPTTTTAPPRE